MKNLIEKISIKTGQTKLEVTALLFIFASIVTGVGLHLAGVGSDETQIATKEKSSWELIQKEKKGQDSLRKERDNEDTRTRLTPVKKPEPYVVKINQGFEEDFDQIPGVSYRLAFNIVDERDRRGHYDEIDDLAVRVKGLDTIKLKQIRPWLSK